MTINQLLGHIRGIEDVDASTDKKIELLDSIIAEATRVRRKVLAPDKIVRSLDGFLDRFGSMFGQGA